MMAKRITPWAGRIALAAGSAMIAAVDGNFGSISGSISGLFSAMISAVGKGGVGATSEAALVLTLPRAFFTLASLAGLSDLFGAGLMSGAGSNGSAASGGRRISACKGSASGASPKISTSTPNNPAR